MQTLQTLTIRNGQHTETRRITRGGAGYFWGGYGMTNHQINPDQLVAGDMFTQMALEDHPVNLWIVKSVVREYYGLKVNTAGGGTLYFYGNDNDNPVYFQGKA